MKTTPKHCKYIIYIVIYGPPSDSDKPSPCLEHVLKCFDVYSLGGVPCIHIITAAGLFSRVAASLSGIEAVRWNEKLKQ